MINNLHPTEDLRALARRKRSIFVFKRAAQHEVDALCSDGWESVKKNRRSVKLRKLKSHDVWLEDRVWSLAHRLGFLHLSGEGGAKLVLDPKDPASPTSQLDVVALDDDTALVFECKSQQGIGKSAKFQEDLAKFALTREKLARYVPQMFPSESKRKLGLCMFTRNYIVSDNDRKRAEDQNVILLNEEDLDYYDKLASHLGEAARYQFLAELFPGKTIPGLEIRIPALKSKMGGSTCYTFSVSPEYLLKIGYVAHRARGRTGDMGAYQRMIKKQRLQKIRDYITKEDGIFPTNIVLNLEKTRHTRFEPVKQEGDQEGALFGFLRLAPAYGSAYIIDGQHRLFSYSGMERTRKSFLSVLAFEGLPVDKQAQLFIDINNEQKSVPRNLLHELLADLKWDEDHPLNCVDAIVSRSIQRLADDPESPFFNRIQLSSDSKDELRCIKVTSMFSPLCRSELFEVKGVKGAAQEGGPLLGSNSTRTMNRTIAILKAWFGWIRDGARDWWDSGAAKEHGGLAMNDSLRACMQVLSSVMSHLDSTGHRLSRLDNDGLVGVLKPYGQVVGQYLGQLTEQERRRYREGRGGSGDMIRRMQMQVAIHKAYPEFLPDGLKDYIENSSKQTNSKAREVLDRIEILIKKAVVDELKAQYPDGDDWFYKGAPGPTRKKVSERMADDQKQRGNIEAYFDLVDYRNIIQHNWEDFKDTFAFGPTSKEKGTDWLVDSNRVRQVTAHVSSGVLVKTEELLRLQEYESWLISKLKGSDLETEGADD